MDYDKEYTVSYECACGYSNKIDFREKGIVKLTWRIDWPMRWNYEKVDFEPGGKDHSAAGGSFDTGKQIIKRFTNISPEEVEMVLVANHGPFTWGKTAEDAVHNTIILEELAKISLFTVLIQPEVKGINESLLDKHYRALTGKLDEYRCNNHHR